MVCRARRADTDMMRAGRSGPTWYLGRGPGRGAWWCADSNCGQALQIGSLARALRTEVSAGDLHEVQGLYQEWQRFRAVAVVED